MNMYIVIAFNLKWQAVGAHVWRRDPPCAWCCNKEYPLNSLLTIESSILAFHGISCVKQKTRCACSHVSNERL